MYFKENYVSQLRLRFKVRIYQEFRIDFFLFSNTQILGYTQNFLEETKHSQYVNEKNESLLQFCQVVEKIFSTGIAAGCNSLGFTKQFDAWTVLKKIAQFKKDGNFQYRYSVENVKKQKNVLTNIGKLRLLIRYCLVNKCLHVPVEYLVCYYFLLNLEII